MFFSKVETSKWKPLWNFCNTDRNDEATADEISSCAAKTADYFEMPKSIRNFLVNFAFKYWNNMDQDGSGSLNFDEFRYSFGAFAAINAGVIMTGFDIDQGSELKIINIQKSGRK